LSPFPGSLFAYLSYTGDPHNYDYLMGVTGAAFRRFWNRDDGGNVDISYLGDEPFRRAFEALGYHWRKVPAQKEAMVQAIKTSLALGRPAISFGISGPPEAGLVTGYTEDGAVIYGWSYFQDWSQWGQNPDTYYEMRDWFETMHITSHSEPGAGKGLILIADRQPSRLTPRDVLVSSLEWALDLERTQQRPNFPEHIAGLAAYDAWAEALDVDADYPAGDVDVLTTRMMVYADQCTMLYERESAARYLRQMINVAPEAGDDLEAAAAFYDQAAAEVGKLWPWGNELGPAAQAGLSEPSARRGFAANIRAAKDKEAQAVQYLERALAEFE
jgi:hypothetical protein